MNAARCLIAGLVLVMLATLPASSETIQLEQLHGIYMVRVRINDAIAIPFVLDSGAAEVAITEDVFLVLLRSGTVSQNDFVGTGTYTMADGSEHASQRYMLHKMAVGGYVITNVVASVVSVKGDPLLGQSFLSKLPAWTLDNAQHALVLHDEAGATPAPELVRRGNQAYAAKDYAEAMRWYRMAADQGNADAQANIGLLYRNGLGVPQNYSEAMRWYRMAADQGNANAQFNIGTLYFNGQGAPQDFAEALSWYRKAAEQGYPEAQYWLGIMYAFGLGTPEADNAASLKWFRKAAEQGYAEAQLQLGSYYRDGDEYGLGLGVPQKNYAQAMQWYRKAADQGNADAQNYIGLMYASGAGVNKDCAIAKQWIERAATAGDKDAQANLRNGAGGLCRW